MKLSILITEDDEGLRPSLERSFARRGYEVFSAACVSEAVGVLQERNIDLVLLDINLPDGSGFDVLEAAHNIDNEIVVIMITAFPDVKTAVSSMKKGAIDFIIKPFELEELHLIVERALETRSLRRNVRLLEHERDRRGPVTDILGESPQILRLREEIQKVAPTDVPVLVAGETGTGKELVAENLYRLSLRRKGPLVKVNCSAFSESILESELFGHEKGAFTDAKTSRAGLFEMADKGTIVLDEISEMRIDLQSKLLRIVEGQPFRRLGGEREIRADVRVIALTNQDLKSQISRGLFREDLYFRLNGFRIDVPALRVRGHDVIELARFYLERCAASLIKPTLRISSGAEESLLNYSWPGNVRELKNLMERAVILCDSAEMNESHLPAEVQSSAFVERAVNGSSDSIPSLREIECLYISRVVERVGGNLTEAARILGIARNTLKAKLRSDAGQQD
ncbi:MAG: sigma-54-dependent Fis family transcriptional regulator [Candidatus Hydrogenedentes bacterium]|nr:sigma-54-dependent Fis family transcriptional regulator [Candidatus Hydrogenedentota bacterium]